MSEHDDIEKIRQEIMRFRELLTIMRGHLETGEKSYARLFARFSDEEKADIKEKDLQWKAAEAMSAEDLEQLSQGVLKMQFNSRELERNFEELYGIIVTPREAEDD